MNQHWAIFINNDSNKSKLLKQLINGVLSEPISFLRDLKSSLFSNVVLEKLMDEEDRHDTKKIAKETEQPLRIMSSGEQKKVISPINGVKTEPLPISSTNSHSSLY